MCVSVGGDEPRTLADELTNLGPGRALAVKQRDPAMPKRVRREVRHAGVQALTEAEAKEALLSYLYQYHQSRRSPDEAQD